MFKGIAFLALSCVIYFGIIYTLYKVEINGHPAVYRFCEVINLKGGNTYQKFREFDREKQYDIIVLGSSHAYRGYDPRIFEQHGIHLFNLGTSGQTAVNSYFVAKNYIHQHTTKLVVLDVFDGAYIAGEMESSADLIQNVSDEKAAIDMALHLKDPRALNMYLVRAFNGSRAPYYTDSTYVGNGFSENRTRVKGKLNYQYYKKKEISSLQLAYLGKILAYFKSQGIPVIMVNTPFPKTWDIWAHQNFDDPIEKLAKEYQVPYDDFGVKMQFDEKAFFYDAHHLNQYGVDRFNEVFIQDMRKTFLKHNIEVK